MATPTDLPSFDSIVQAERLRKKNEDLAAEIFGRKVKPASTARNRKSDATPSLASRIGISKPSQRSHSLTPKSRPILDSSRTRDQHASRNGRPSPFSPTALNKIAARMNQNGQSQQPDLITSPQQAPSQPQEEVSIRGIAAPEGPFTVVGSNFAPGTTAADIEAALMSTGGAMLKCKILTASPTVMAEMVFTEKTSADRVIETFNNRKADGRLLHIYLRNDTRSTKSQPTAKSPPPAAVAPAQEPMEISQPEPSYNTQRELSDRQRRNAEPAHQDGSYGFGHREDAMDVEMDDRRNDGRRNYDRRIDDRRNTWRDNGRYGSSRDAYRGRENRNLYSDDLYRGGRGRGYR